MKKMYVKPSMEIVELYSDVAILAGSNPESSPIIGIVGKDDASGDAESNNRRGGWGNLWE